MPFSHVPAIKKQARLSEHSSNQSAIYIQYQFNPFLCTHHTAHIYNAKRRLDQRKHVVCVSSNSSDRVFSQCVVQVIRLTQQVVLKLITDVTSTETYNASSNQWISMMQRVLI